MMKNEIKVGDEIVVTKKNPSGEWREYFKEGDIAVITEIDKDGDLWGDFSNFQEERVIDDGIWCITQFHECTLLNKQLLHS